MWIARIAGDGGPGARPTSRRTAPARPSESPVRCVETWHHWEPTGYVSPMDEGSVERRLRAGEDSRTEFKSARDDLQTKTLAKEIAAFANSQGGLLFLGVEDDGTPTGVGTLREAD